MVMFVVTVVVTVVVMVMMAVAAHRAGAVEGSKLGVGVERQAIELNGG